MKMHIPVTTTIEIELRKLADENRISIKEAAELGLKIILADNLIIDEYPDCVLLRKMNKFRKLSEELSQELEKLKEEDIKEDDTKKQGEHENNKRIGN